MLTLLACHAAAGLPLHRDGRPLALWNRDCTDYPDLNLYGSHPFLLEVRPGAVTSPLRVWLPGVA